jgi:hypothetical protein
MSMADVKQLNIIGGTYLESCVEPNYYDLYGSGLRAACALSEKGFDISFISCVGDEELSTAQSACSIFNIKDNFVNIEETVLFEYYHPLSKPVAYSKVFLLPIISLPELKAEFILFYGLIEATIQVDGNFVVYDPQNGIPFSKTNSKAQHLALVLNRLEVLTLANMTSSGDLSLAGKLLLEQEHAEVVIIKDGSNGGLIVTPSGVDYFSVYQTTKVWPIGSGDIFSAAFAWQWVIEGKSPAEAAIFASQCAAEFCETQSLPLPIFPKSRISIKRNQRAEKDIFSSAIFYKFRTLVRK